MGTQFSFKFFLSSDINWLESGLSYFKVAIITYDLLEPIVLMKEADIFVELIDFSNHF